jgi:hypothetical protein
MLNGKVAVPISSPIFRLSEDNIYLANYLKKMNIMNIYTKRAGPKSWIIQAFP